jgi:hypothetical protein
MVFISFSKKKVSPSVTRFRRAFNLVPGSANVFGAALLRVALSY